MTNVTCPINHHGYTGRYNFENLSTLIHKKSQKTYEAGKASLQSITPFLSQTMADSALLGSLTCIYAGFGAAGGFGAAVIAENTSHFPTNYVFIKLGVVGGTLMGGAVGALLAAMELGPSRAAKALFVTVALSQLIDAIINE